MNFITVTLILTIGLVFWGGWPLIAQGSKLTDPFVRGFLINVVTAIGFIPFLPGRISATTMASEGIGLLFLAGLFNFAGHALFPKLQTAAGSQISFYMAILPGLFVIANAVGGPIFYGDPITFLKVFFTLVIVAGIIGLTFTS
ncbi:MAG: hypothetical protein Q8R40_04660 [bacterium]|nr:hypothetical protein [bacterium]